MSDLKLIQGGKDSTVQGIMDGVMAGLRQELDKQKGVLKEQEDVFAAFTNKVMGAAEALLGPAPESVRRMATVARVGAKIGQARDLLIGAEALMEDMQDGL